MAENRPGNHSWSSASFLRAFVKIMNSYDWMLFLLRLKVHFNHVIPAFKDSEIDVEFLILIYGSSNRALMDQGSENNEKENIYDT